MIVLAAKFFQAISHVNVWLKTNVSETNPVSVRVNIRRYYNLPIFISVSLYNVLFLLAGCAAKYDGTNFSG
jgi:hypothetical protein